MAPGNPRRSGRTTRLGRCGPWRKSPVSQGLPLAPPPRAERGEVKHLVLDAVGEGPAHGYEVIQTIEQRTRGQYRPSPGTVYPTLQSLEQQGLIVSRNEAGRKVYAATDSGRAELAAHAPAIAGSYERLSGEAATPRTMDPDVVGDHLDRILRPLRRALDQDRLRPEQWNQIIDAIDAAADRIDRILRRA